MILENYVSVNSENESFEENKKAATFFTKPILYALRGKTSPRIYRKRKSAFRERTNKHMNLLEKQPSVAYS